MAQETSGLYSLETFLDVITTAIHIIASAITLIRSLAIPQISTGII